MWLENLMAESPLYGVITTYLIFGLFTCTVFLVCLLVNLDESLATIKSDLQNDYKNPFEAVLAMCGMIIIAWPLFIMMLFSYEGEE